MKEAYCRNTVCSDTGKGTLVFQPKPLAGNEAAETQVKRGVFGATMIGRPEAYSACPIGATVWDVALMKQPPAQLRPTRPRFWLLCPFEMKANIYYLLAPY